MTTKISSDNIQAATLNTLGGPKISTIGYPGDDTAANPAGGQTITLTGSGFENGAGVIINNSAVGVVTVVSSTTITFTSPALATGSYPIYVVNTNGGTAIAVPGIQYSGVPTWSTAAGSLGSLYETAAISNTVTATGDAPISYSLYSGTLPTGATLNTSNGLISGTSVSTASSTTYTFTIRATDAEQQDTDRQFSLTVNPDVVTWSSPANNTTYTSNVNQSLSNVTLSATSAAGYNVSYTANALPTGLSINGANITGTPTVIANSSSLLTATAATTSRTATRTINWVIQVGNDPYFNYTTLLLSGETATNTWITDISTNNFSVTVNGDTRPSAFSPYETVYSNYFDGTGDYLSLTGATALNFGTGDFTVELWVYFNSIAADRGFLGSTSGGGYDFVWRTSTGLNIGRINTAFDNTFAWSPSTNLWYHVAYSRSGSSLRVFVNGTQVGSTATNSNAYDGGGTVIIGGSTNVDRLMNGYISNMRLVKGTALYTSNFTPSTTPLTAIANTSLLTCQSNRLIDNSNNAFSITKNGDVTVSGFGPFTETDTTTGSGYFDGTADFLTAPSNSAFDFGTGNFTMECWIYPTNLANAPAIIAKATSTGSGVGWFIEAAANVIYFGYGTNSGQFATFTVSLVVNAWHHIACTRVGSVVNCFVNGVSPGSQTLSGGSSSYDNSNPLQIGRGFGNAGYDFAGYISNARIVKGTAVYTSAFTPPTTPLTEIANTSLLTLQNRIGENNNRFIDTSGINNIITRNGNATQGTFTPFSQTGWSNYFDGTGDYLSTPANAAFNFGSGDFTLECWIYSLANQATYAGVLCNINQSDGFYFSFSTGSNNMGFSNYSAYSISSSSTTIQNNVWTHVALARSGTTIRMFFNGSIVGTATNNTTSYGSSVSATTIGFNGVSSYFNGYVSNARIIKGTALYTSAFTPPTSPLTAIANTSLLTCQSNRFIDNSANNFTITRNGDVSVQSFSPFASAVITPTSYSGYFDGTGDSLSLSAATALSLGTGDFTMEAWIYPTSINSTFWPILEGRSAGSSIPYAFGLRLSGGNLRGTLYDGADRMGSINIPYNSWTHLVFTREGTTLRSFVNGVLDVNTAGYSTNLNISGTQYIGALIDPLYSVGYISNLRVVKGTAVYTSNFTPPTSPLTAIANTSLLTCQSNSFVDNSTNNFTITVNGDSKPTQFNPFGNTSTTGSNASYSITNVGGSMYCDGSGDFITLPSSNNTALGSGDFTFEFWINPSINNHSATWVINWNTEPRIQIDNRTLVLYASGVARITSGNILNAGTWTHVALVRSGSNIRMYADGVQTGSTYVSSTNFTSQPLDIGYTPFNGYISGVRLIKSAIYTSTFTPPTAPPTPQYLSYSNTATILLNFTNAGIIDYTSKNVLETVGDTKLSTSVKKFGNASMYFDGTGDYLYVPSSLNYGYGTGDFTIEFWLYLNSTGLQTILSHLSSNPQVKPHIYYSSGVRLYVNGSDVITGGSVTISTWTHIAISRSGSSTKLFINGTQSGSTYTDTNNYGTSSPLIIADYGVPVTGTNMLNGYIDDLRITKGIARYTSNFTPPTSAFITF